MRASACGESACESVNRKRIIIVPCIQERLFHEEAARSAHATQCRLTNPLAVKGVFQNPATLAKRIAATARLSRYKLNEIEE
jgi:hypothetical protein